MEKKKKKHLHKFVIVNLPKNPGIFHLQDANIISDDIQTSKQTEACKPVFHLYRPWLLLLWIPPSRPDLSRPLLNLL